MHDLWPPMAAVLMCFYIKLSVHLLTWLLAHRTLLSSHAPLLPCLMQFMAAPLLPPGLCMMSSGVTLTTGAVASIPFHSIPYASTLYDYVTTFVISIAVTVRPEVLRCR